MKTISIRIEAQIDVPDDAQINPANEHELILPNGDRLKIWTQPELHPSNGDEPHDIDICDLQAMGCDLDIASATFAEDD